MTQPTTTSATQFSALRDDIDPNGLLEYSVVYTDRALNHMSQSFQGVMNDLSTELKAVYNADSAVIVPGGGTFAMESVARQLATDKRVLVVRNGWFSFRWSQIFDMGHIPSHDDVMVAAPSIELLENEAADLPKPFSPAPIAEVVAKINDAKPEVVFMPHVETASGIILSDEYIKQVADATHAVGGLLVLDCVASGCIWVDMAALGVDVLISAPQKGWSSTPCAGLVMLSKAALAAVESSTSTSFALDLKKWLEIMRAYENGGHAYHATMPTDGLKTFRDTLVEAKNIGFAALKQAQYDLGAGVRKVLTDKGFISVAADGFGAPGVVVCYTDRDDLHKGAAFKSVGVQIAGGVPLRCGEPDSFKTFRVGLFGLDKLKDVDAAVKRFEAALERVV